MLNKNYIPRLVDKKISESLQDFTAVHIRGPKWCGKTTTAEHFAKSEIKLNTKKQREEFDRMYAANPSLFMEGEKPRLIDEWQLYPAIWDEIKNYADETHLKNQFLLTGSFSPKIGSTNHTGSMRIVKIDMTTMSLFESGDSTGEVSLKSLFDNPTQSIKIVLNQTKRDISKLIVRGGWPEGIINQPHNSLSFGRQALKDICETDIQEASGKELNPVTAKVLLRSLARTLSQNVDNRTIIQDINSSGHPLSESIFYDYYSALLRLFVVKEISAWCPNIRSKTAIRSLPKKEFFDPSLACAALDINEEGLERNFKTRGFFFECLVGRDLEVYSKSFDGDISYYRDRLGLECDFVIHLPDGRYGLFEVKTGDEHLRDGIDNLNKFVDLINNYNENNPQSKMKLPTVRAIITDDKYGYVDKSGIFIIPITALKD